MHQVPGGDTDQRSGRKELLQAVGKRLWRATSTLLPGLIVEATSPHYWGRLHLGARLWTAGTTRSSIARRLGMTPTRSPSGSADGVPRAGSLN
jgi:hypothetical protein